jgi:hypothetical protein
MKIEESCDEIKGESVTACRPVMFDGFVLEQTSRGTVVPLTRE